MERRLDAYIAPLTTVRPRFADRETEERRNIESCRKGLKDSVELVKRGKLDVT